MAALTLDVPTLPVVEVRALTDGAPLWWVHAGDRVVVEISVTGAAADTEVLGDWATTVEATTLPGLLDVGCAATRCWIDVDVAPADADRAFAALGRALKKVPSPRPGVDTRSGWGAGPGPAWPAARGVVIASPEDPARWAPALEAMLTGYGVGAPIAEAAPAIPMRRDTGTGVGVALPDTAEGDWFAALLFGRTTARVPAELRARRGTLYSVVRAGPWWTLDTPDDAATLAIVTAMLEHPVHADEWSRAAAWLKTDTLRHLDAPADVVWLATGDLLAGRAPLSRARELLALSTPPTVAPTAAILIGGER